MRIATAAAAVGALAATCWPAAAAQTSCKTWKAAVSLAAQTDAFELIRGARMAPKMYLSKLHFAGFTHCLVGVTDGALLTCFLMLPNKSAGQAAYASAVADMQTCLAGWTPLELAKQSGGPERLAGRRLTKTFEGAKLQALIILQGPVKKGSPNHVVSLAVGAMPQTPVS